MPFHQMMEKKEGEEDKKLNLESKLKSLKMLKKNHVLFSY